MYKKTVTFKNLFNEKEITETYYFHITKARLTRNMDIKDDLESFQNRIEGDDRDLTTKEKQEVFELTERLLKLSYGIRTEDGRHINNDEVWDEFVDTPAYDAVIFSIFETNKSAIEFMTGILPHDLQEETLREIEREEEGRTGASVAPVRPKVPLDRLQKGGEPLSGE